ncbi:hypothetical protein BK634_15510 [Pseudomonas chlororaphis]|nr:hypothetical protein BK634_15510 [Pseudomonas chlororaphis]WEK11975.1 MAG: hypothetical protein P0Y51_15360 [Pseudomonas sp.]
MKRIGLPAVLCLGIALGGCGTRMQPLDYRSAQPYVPLSLDLGPSRSRLDVQEQQQTLNALRATGAFSFLDGGYSRSGYSLLISEPGGKSAGIWGALNALTLLTFPLPYSYQSNLQGDLLKDGQLLKRYRYRREGYSVAAWYVPPVQLENRREMLDELLQDLERDRLIPHENLQ